MCIHISHWSLSCGWFDMYNTFVLMAAFCTWLGSYLNTQITKEDISRTHLALGNPSPKIPFKPYITPILFVSETAANAC